MTTTVGVAIVGASVAAGSVVSGLRAGGYAGTIVAIDPDPDAPYDRPPLSKEFLDSRERRPAAAWWSGECNIIRAAAVALDPTRALLTIRDDAGAERLVAAEHVVLATGSAPVRLSGLLDGVLPLRTAADARDLRNRAVPGSHAVILGAGTVGTEVASSLSAAGVAVTVVEPAPRPLDRLLAGHLGEWTAAWIRDGGVELLLGTRMERVVRDARGFTVHTDNCGALHADVVVSAVGARPNIGWLEGSGVAVGDGVQCDADGAVRTRDGRIRPDVHAVGDVAAWTERDGTALRREDWTSAQRQGRHVAGLITGFPHPGRCDEPDYFWSHQFGRRLQILGRPTRDAQLTTSMHAPTRNASFHTLTVADTPVAWIAVNAPREFALATREALRQPRMPALSP